MRWRVVPLSPQPRSRILPNPNRTPDGRRRTESIVPLQTFPVSSRGEQHCRSIHEEPAMGSRPDERSREDPPPLAVARRLEAPSPPRTNRTRSESRGQHAPWHHPGLDAEAAPFSQLCRRGAQAKDELFQHARHQADQTQDAHARTRRPCSSAMRAGMTLATVNEPRR
jgi:hypothetical protein